IVDRLTVGRGTVTQEPVRRVRIGDEFLVGLQRVMELRDLIGGNPWVGPAEDGEDRNPDLARQLERRQPLGWRLEMAVVANYTDQAAHPGGRHVGQPPTHAESPRGDSCRAARLQAV